MTWTKLDENFFDHPKVAACSSEAQLLQVRALVYANRLETDGHLSPAIVERLAADLAYGRPLLVEELLKAGIWEQNGNGWIIHDFTDWQPSKAKLIRERRKTNLRLKRFRKRQRNGVSTPVKTPEKRYSEPEPEPEPVIDKELPNGSSPVERVWTAYMATEPGGYRLTEPKRVVIRRALKTFDEATVMNAVRGWINDPWSERRQHNQIEKLLRSSNIERMADFFVNGPPALPAQKGEEPLGSRFLRGGKP